MPELPAWHDREEAESDCCTLQVIWFATRCMGTRGFDLELINCTIGKVSN